MNDDLIGRLHRYSEACVAYKLDADFASAVQEAADAIEELTDRNVGKWIPVTERLPERNTWVLAYCKYKDHVVDYVDINGLWSYGNVTHWMPLPEPPKEEK